MADAPRPAFDCPSPEALASDDVWWEIYRASFPAEEREPPHVIISSLRRAGIAVRARFEMETVGLATMHVLRDPPTVFLVYLAVNERLRSQGLGGLLFKEAWCVGVGALVEEGRPPFGMVWEVDSPEASDDEPERRRRERRIEFFCRHGASLVDHAYMQPPVDGTNAVAMRLMYRPALAASSLRHDSIQSLVRAIYFEKYGTANGIPRETLEALLHDTFSKD